MPALLILLVGFGSLAAQLWVVPSEVDKKEWKKPADWVKKQLEPSDAVRVHPAWTEDPLPYLEDVGSQVHRHQDPVESDLEEIRRVWILTETERLEGALAKLPFEPSRPDLKRFGDVTVIKAIVPSSVRSSYELLEHLEGAKVERIEKKSVQHCDKWDEKDRRWDCGERDRWLYVGEHEQIVAGDPRRCIWAHPLPKQKVLRITFPGVPLEETLRVRAGLSFKGARFKRGTPVRMQVRVGGERRYDHQYGPRTSTWGKYDIDTTASAGSKKPVVFEISSDKIRRRWFCFNAWVR